MKKHYKKKFVKDYKLKLMKSLKKTKLPMKNTNPERKNKPISSLLKMKPKHLIPRPWLKPKPLWLKLKRREKEMPMEDSIKLICSWMICIKLLNCQISVRENLIPKNCSNWELRVNISSKTGSPPLEESYQPPKLKSQRWIVKNGLHS